MKRTRKQAASSRSVKRRRTDDGTHITPDADPRSLDAASSRRKSSNLDDDAEHALIEILSSRDGSPEEGENNVSAAGPVTIAEKDPNDTNRKASEKASFGPASGRIMVEVGRSKQRWPKATEVGEDFKSTVPPGPGSSDAIASDSKATTPNLSSAAEDVLAGLEPEPALDEAGDGTVQSRVFEAVVPREDTTKPSRKKQKGNEKEVKLPAASGNRIRFDSAEPPIAMTLPDSAPLEEVLAADNHVAAIQSKEEGAEESEDEAPETLSRNSAVERNRALNKRVTEAINQQGEAARAKRRKKQKDDEAAKRSKVVQLETNTGNVFSEEHETPEDINPNPSEHVVSPKPFVLPSDELPALLPDSVFEEAVAPSRVSLDSLPLAKIKPKPKVSLNDAKPTKDVKKGPLKVRVLEETNPLLAPKASRGSEHLKDSWLKGRRGTDKMNMKLSVHRRKFNRAFFRRV